MLGLVDGDIAAYRAAVVTQKDIDFGDGESITHAAPEEAAKAAIHTIRMWAESAGATKVLVCLTGEGNFRKTVYPAYKSNRAGVVRPIALKRVQEAIREEFPTATVPGLEADDLLGLALTAPKAAGKAVCISMDKDLRTVPGLHFNPAKDKLPVFVTTAEANRWWMTQTLTGDACDGYPGCPGIGPKKAEKWLETWDGENASHGFGEVAMAFWKQGKTILMDDAFDRALVQARIARILRFGDYDKSTGEVILWHPTTPTRLKL